MITFKEYINELTKDMGQLDLAFIKRAEVVTSFNISAKDYESTNNKAEIQYLFKKHFFPNFDLSSTLASFNEGQFNMLVDQLKSMDKSKFQSLLKYQPKGVGPGEVLMYFLVDDLHLGGGSSAGLDVTSGGTGYEVKAANLSRTGYFNGFKIGGTINISDELSAAAIIKNKLATELKLRGRETEINKSQITLIKKSRLANDWMEKVEIPYQKKAYEYFKGHDTIFLINENPKAIQGKAFVKKISPSDIELDVVTNGTIKPQIKK